MRYTTLRMYVKGKACDITDIHYSVNQLQKTEPFNTPVFITLSFGQPVRDEQKERLPGVAKNCPVAKLLQDEIVIDTYLSDKLQYLQALAITHHLKLNVPWQLKTILRNQENGERLYSDIYSYK